MPFPHRREVGVSICIPNWNHRDFLPRSVGSARSAALRLRQAGLSCQVCVIDDGSRDGSQRALMAMALCDEHDLIDVVILPSNKGLAAARNTALRHVQYTHVCFLDADNEIIPGNFAAFVRSILMTKAAAVYGNLIGHNGQRADRLISNCYVHDGIYEENFVDAFAIYDAERLLEVGGFNESLTSHEDWEMHLHLLAENEDIVFVPLCLGYYYVVENSMVKTEKFDVKRMHRIFSQRQKSGSLATSRRRMFHPDLGWL